MLLQEWIQTDKNGDGLFNFLGGSRGMLSQGKKIVITKTIYNWKQRFFLDDTNCAAFIADILMLRRGWGPLAGRPPFLGIAKRCAIMAEQ